MLVGVFGTGRNGSTMLGRLLDGSPDLWVHPIELNYLAFFSDLARFGRVRAGTAQNAVTEPLRLDGALPAELLAGTFQHQIDEFVDEQSAAALPAVALPADGVARADEYLPRMLDAIRAAFDRRGRPVSASVFKTIETPYVEDYVRVFPTMRFVHLVRDPLATYSSLKRTNMLIKRWPFWRHGGDQLRMLLEQRWLPHARFAVEHAPADPGRHLVVRHEDVVAAPAETIGGICSWLGVEPPPEPDVQTVLGGLRADSLPVNSSQPGIPTPARVVSDMSARYEYTDVLTAREREFIVFKTQSLATRLGYPSSGDASRLRLAARWLPVDRWERMNSDSPLRSLAAVLARRRYVYGSLLRP